jgi:ferritin-like metal-binding protein YciE
VDAVNAVIFPFYSTRVRLTLIEGIIEEGQEIMKEYKSSPALDAGLLSAAQSVEHYEISRYGTLRTWAEAMGLGRARTLLQQTLDEEIATGR